MNKIKDISTALFGAAVALILWITILSREKLIGIPITYHPFHALISFFKEIQKGRIGTNFLGNIVVPVDTLDGYSLLRILVGEALCSGKLIHPRIGTVGVNIVLDLYELVFLSLDQADSMIAVLAVILVPELLGCNFSVVGRGVHGHQVIHLVSPVDVERLADGAEAMGRIVVATVVDVVVNPPGFAPVPILCEEMDIGAFHMIDLAEQAVLRHVQG